MSETPEEKFAYWKQRITDKITSVNGQLELDFKSILSDADHIQMETKEIFNAIYDIMQAVNKLKESVQKAEVKKPAEKKTVSKAEVGIV